ncbi:MULTISPECIES: type II toxin-antitoxin system PemK/MazF family toxin [unclassified Arthrobacter]|uniref:type II toxin-antitoxin system PemK/MazF family toxin n=1 Tax=unclassified Arthrobacter TaxID=235627 RepID=UPI00264E1BE2|nr:type II toxin-antitoxin system PemK/MazF family toxin [Micrococcaceae bacterium]MDN5887551.1 type II toxin-antitoxin system PemK/MazF family toxin [Micrococcaceae bacterium]
MQISAGNIRKLVRLGSKAFRAFRRSQGSTPGPSRSPGTSPAGSSGPEGGRPYPGDYEGRFTPRYAPRPDGHPDPGEIVWTWVPYEEDPSRGKDRPVLLVGRDGEFLLGLMLTSQDHNNRRHRDRDYVDIGTGAWDRAGRPSEVKVDRVIRVDPQGIRREGAVLDRGAFERVGRALGGA